MNKLYTYTETTPILSKSTILNFLTLNPLNKQSPKDKPIWQNSLRYIAAYALFFCLSLFILPAFAQVNVLMHHNNPERNGVNYRETRLNTSNVNAKSFGKL